MAISNRVRDRVVNGLRRLAPIIAQQKTRDVSEADTVTLVKDILSDVFGYDKYAELTSEHAIRGTFCDLAIRLEEKLVELVEIKAVGIALDDRHVKQGVDYAANQGIEWVILTNGVVWRLYQVVFAKPIDKRLLLEIDLLNIDPKKEDQLEKLYLFSKEGFSKGAHIELRDRQDASSRYMIAALLLNNESVIATIRRELRRVVDVGVDEDVILHVLREEIIKRETLEGPQAEHAIRRVSRREDRPLRTARAKAEDVAQPSPTQTPASQPSAES
jgi:predicted type IV restriction endonuclease